MKPKNILAFAAVLAALSVAIGAFGAHGLAKLLEQAGRTNTFETAVRYQYYHTFGLFILGILAKDLSVKAINITFYCFTLGILIFSGSLYALCLSGITLLGAITPLGGLLFIAGWLNMAYSAAKLKSQG